MCAALLSLRKCHYVYNIYAILYDASYTKTLESSEISFRLKQNKLVAIIYTKISQPTFKLFKKIFRSL